MFQGKKKNMYLFDGCFECSEIAEEERLSLERTGVILR
jgi:hypothetical protein